MNNQTFYNEILTEHNRFPSHKYKMAMPQFTQEGVNPSCGDDLILSLNIDDKGIITEGSFEGCGCAISQASADIMFDLIIGKNVKEALELSDIFSRMIKEKITEEETERLEEACALKDIAHMPARAKCALLAWRTLSEIIKKSYGGNTI